MYIFRVHTQVGRGQQMKFTVEICEKRYKQEMKTGFNQVLIKGLQKDVNTNYIMFWNPMLEEELLMY